MGKCGEWRRQLFVTWGKKTATGHSKPLFDTAPRVAVAVLVAYPEQAPVGEGNVRG